MIYDREVFNCANCPSKFPLCGVKKKQTEGICRKCQELRGCIKTGPKKKKTVSSKPSEGVN